MSTNTKLKGLYHPSFERDSCGFGLIANIDDKPSHWLIKTSIAALATGAVHRRLCYTGGRCDTNIVVETGSEWGRYILENFSHFKRKIWMVKPKAAEFDSLLETLQRNAA